MDLHYEIQGQGKPVILLHGGGIDSRDWLFLAPQLAQTHQVVLFDGRGAGQSPLLLKPADFVEDLRMLLDHLSIEQAILVGHSIGGQIAIDFALAYPHRVSKLVLVASGLSGFKPSPDVEQWFEQIKAAVPDAEKMTQLVLSHPIHSVVMASPQRELLIAMTQHNIERSLEWKTFEMRWSQPPAIERLGEIQPKTLFMIGTQEMADNLHIAELCQQIPDIRFVRIDGADHMPTLTHPDQLSTLIFEFLSES